MRTIVTVGFAIGLLAALPAQASNANANANRNDNSAREQPQAGGSSTDSDDRQVCVREAQSESHIRRQICHTAREWREMHGDPSNGS